MCLQREDRVATARTVAGMALLRSMSVQCQHHRLQAQHPTRRGLWALLSSAGQQRWPIAAQLFPTRQAIMADTSSVLASPVHARSAPCNCIKSLPTGDECSRGGLTPLQSEALPTGYVPAALTPLLLLCKQCVGGASARSERGLSLTVCPAVDPTLGCQCS